MAKKPQNRPKPKRPPPNPTGRTKSGALPRTVFKPGKSGNPGGRPKDLPEFRKQVREMGTEVALQRLVHNVVLAPAMEANKACEILLAYGWGRPSVAVEVSGPNGGPVEVSDARDRVIARLAGLLAAGAGAAPGDGAAG